MPRREHAGEGAHSDAARTVNFPSGPQALITLRTRAWQIEHGPASAPCLRPPSARPLCCAAPSEPPLQRCLGYEAHRRATAPRSRGR